MADLKMIRIKPVKQMDPEHRERELSADLTESW